MPDLSITGAGRLDAHDPQQKLRQAAKAFEQQFVSQLLKPMGERSEATSDLFGEDPGSSAFQGLFVDGMAEHATGGLGVAAIIERELAARIRVGGSSR
jgi:Rod binding domain-containing protein